MVLEVVDDGALTVGVRPESRKIGELRETAENTFACIIEEVGNLQRLAIIADDVVDLVELGNALAAFDMNLLELLLVNLLAGNLNLLVLLGLAVAILGCATRAVGIQLGFAVKLGVEEQARGIAEVEDIEVPLVDFAFAVDIDTRATTNHLLEQRHGVDFLVDDDESASLAIDACGEQFGGSDDDGVLLLGVDEAVEHLLAIFILAGDAHDVVRALGHFVAEEHSQHITHLGGFLLVGTEDDGFGIFAQVLELLLNLNSNGYLTLVDIELASEIRSFVHTHGHFVAFGVFLAELDNIAVDIHIEMHTRDAIGRKETVLDALLEAIGVYGFVEVVEVVGILLAFGRSGQTNLRGAAEVFEHLAPCGVLLGTAAVALVNDDEVEEVRVELQVRLLLVILVADELLVERHVQFVGRIELLACDLGHNLLERLEVLLHRLVDEDIAVGQIEDMMR